MLIVGFDPGETTGWCHYDTEKKRVLEAGEFHKHHVPGSLLRVCDMGTGEHATRVVVEGFAAVHAGIYPQTVAAAYTCGRLVQTLQDNLSSLVAEVHEMTRIDVKRILQRLVHNEIHVQKDRDVWAALKLLHGGEDSAKKGGPLYGVKSHARAALALCVAWTNRHLLEPVKA